MDVYCQQCGEPWDVLSVTEMNYREDGGTRIQFYRGDGCPSCKWGKDESKTKNQSEASMLMSAAVDILGDDVDGIAATLEDFEAVFGDF